MCAGRGAGKAVGQPLVGGGARARAERPRGTVGAERVHGDDQVAEPESSDIAPQVPTRMALRAPRLISSLRTIAADGPPIPVAWMVAGPPSGAVPCSPTGRGGG